jgi:hypothetical protein
MTDITRKTRRTSEQAARAARRTNAPDGGRVVIVPLAGGRPAKIDEADYELVLRLGLSPAWVLNDDGDGRCYVRTRRLSKFGASNNVQVARVLMTPPPGCVVKHADGDHLNLRRANLLVVEGPTRAKARERHWKPQGIAA